MNQQQNAYFLAQLLSQATGRNILPVQQNRMVASSSQLANLDTSQLAGALQNTGVDFGALLDNAQGGSSNNELRSMIRDNAKSIESLRETIQRNLGGSGGRIQQPNYRRGIGGGIHHSAPGSGGVNPTDVFTVPSAGGVAENEVATVAFSGIDLDRIRNNVLCKFEAVTGPDTAAQAENIVVDMFWNNDSVPEVQNIPLSYLIPTLEGQRQYWELGRYVETNITPSFEVTFGEAFTPSANEPLFFRAISGEDCG